MALSAQLQCAALGTAHTVLAPRESPGGEQIPCLEPCGQQGDILKPFLHLKAVLSLQTSQPVGIGLLFIPACPAKLTAAELWEC